MDSRSRLQELLPKLVLAPSFLIVLVFVYGFIAYTGLLSLTDSKMLPSYNFVGLQNYIRLFNPSTFFTRGQFGSSLIITTQFVLLSALIGQALLGLLLAWLMQAIPPALKRAVEAAVIGAWILPEVVIGFAWFAFLDYDNGTLNMILTSLGLPRGDFLLQQPFWVIVIFNTWRGAAFSMMLFNSAFSSIPPSYFQAADVAAADGAAA